MRVFTSLYIGNAIIIATVEMSRSYRIRYERMRERHTKNSEHIQKNRLPSYPKVDVSLESFGLIFVPIRKHTSFNHAHTYEYSAISAYFGKFCTTVTKPTYRFIHGLALCMCDAMRCDAIVDSNMFCFFLSSRFFQFELITSYNGNVKNSIAPCTLYIQST